MTPAQRSTGWGQERGRGDTRAAVHGLGAGAQGRCRAPYGRCHVWGKNGERLGMSQFACVLLETQTKEVTHGSGRKEIRRGEDFSVNPLATMVQLLPVTRGGLSLSSATLLPIQLLANVAGKAAEDASSA